MADRLLTPTVFVREDVSRWNYGCKNTRFLSKKNFPMRVRERGSRDLVETLLAKGTSKVVYFATIHLAASLTLVERLHRQYGRAVVAAALGPKLKRSGLAYLS